MTESAENAAPEGDAGTTNTPEPKSVRDLPEWAQELIGKTRQEAADYRTRLREAKDEVRGEVKAEFESKLTELSGQVAEFEQHIADKDLNYSKLEVALDAGLAGQQAVAFAGRLRGTTVEELRTDAAEALKIFGTAANGQSSRATDPSQGLGSEPPKTTNQIMGDFISSRLGK